MMRTLSVACAAMICVSACVSSPGGRVQRPSGQAMPQQERPLLSEVAKISDLAQVKAHARNFPRASTLIVFDIDDTLLTTSEIAKNERKFFGSDRWYLWQNYGLPTEDKDKIGNCLFEVIAANADDSTEGSQVPTQADAVSIVADIPNDMLLLTSRGTSMKDATLKQLAWAKYRAIPSLGQVAGPMPIATDGVIGVYEQGVFLTEGANKGRALIALLDATGRRYDYVILVDDTEKNVLNMATAMAMRGIGYLGLRYTRIKNDPPLEVTPAQVEAHRRDWQAFLGRHPDKKTRWEGKQCK
ncbi:MAG: DUF2608 domain-containing protein [Xanthomonadaceae bacterium]|nr:DUF2608 domain-containing protein [Xanthomonadaceae bacterium]